MGDVEVEEQNIVENAVGVLRVLLIYLNIFCEEDSFYNSLFSNISSVQPILFQLCEK